MTTCFRGDGFGEEASVVVVFARFTMTNAFGDVLGKKVPSPRYLADAACVPTLKVAVTNVAAPLLNVDVPSELAPLKNSTCPVGVPVVEEAITVSDTA